MCLDATIANIHAAGCHEQIMAWAGCIEGRSAGYIPFVITATKIGIKFDKKGGMMIDRSSLIGREVRALNDEME